MWANSGKSQIIEKPKYTEKAHWDGKQGCEELRSNKYTLASRVLGARTANQERAHRGRPLPAPPNNSQAEHTG